MKNKKILVFANGWSNEYVERVLEGIRSKAAEDGVDVFLFMTYIFFQGAALQNKAQLNIFHLPNPKDYDGAIVFTNTFNIPDEQERICALFQREGLPMISTEVRIPDMAFVGTDNYAGMYELANHLIEEHGVKKVVYMRGIEGHPECAIRKKALTDALAKHNLELVDTLAGDFGYVGAVDRIEEWLAAGKELPDAFVCANDHMALGAQYALFSHGYDVPKDVIVTGFDYIQEARVSLPLLATVSRQWEKFGEHAYEQLKAQIAKPDNSYEKVYPSKFVQAESCGCKPSQESIAYRLEYLRGTYAMTSKNNLLDIFFQNVLLYMAKVESMKEFNEVAKERFDGENYLGDDFSICLEPSFFETMDEDYPQRIRGYSRKMDVAYEKSGGKSVEPYTFNSARVVPDYHKEPGKSNLYVIVPFNNMNYIIGYVVIKNAPEMVYNLTLRKWIANMNSLFVNIREHIFAQQTNRKLTEIYMTDFLTGMYNRTGCEKVIYAFIKKQKEEGRSSLLLFADIDRMKTINDVHGHLNGDLAIKATSDAMRKSLPESWLLGRFGGDEFIAVGPCANEEIVPVLGKNLRDSMTSYIKSFNLNFRLSVSVGYAVIRPDDEGDIDDYIEIADEGMYEQKELAHKRIDEEAKKSK